MLALSLIRRLDLSSGRILTEGSQRGQRSLPAIPILFLFFVIPGGGSFFTARIHRAHRSLHCANPIIRCGRWASTETARSHVSSLRPHLHIQQLDFPVQMAPFDLQIFGGARDIPMVLTKLATDKFFFKRVPRVFQRIVRFGEERA